MCQSIHSISMELGVDIDDVLRADAYGEDTVESQDNPSPEDWSDLREERRRMEAMYFKAIRSEGRFHRRFRTKP